MSRRYYIDLWMGVVNNTLGQVGIIRQFVSTNVAWVQLTQSAGSAIESFETT